MFNLFKRSSKKINNQRAYDKKTRDAIDNLSVWPYIEHNFIDQETVNKFLNYIEKYHHQYGELGNSNQIETYWKGRSIFYDAINDNSVKMEMGNVRDRLIKRVEQILKENLNIEDELFGDLLAFSRWPVGYDLKPHADSENPNNQPHPFSHRNFGAMVYLNDNFEGGEIFFPNQNFSMKPVPGTFVVFPGTINYLHGVKTITQGERYTLSSFLTFDYSKSDGNKL